MENWTPNASKPSLAIVTELSVAIQLAVVRPGISTPDPRKRDARCIAVFSLSVSVFHFDMVASWNSLKSTDGQHIFRDNGYWCFLAPICFQTKKVTRLATVQYPSNPIEPGFRIRLACDASDDADEVQLNAVPKKLQSSSRILDFGGLKRIGLPESTVLGGPRDTPEPTWFCASKSRKPLRNGHALMRFRRCPKGCITSREPGTEVRNRGSDQRSGGMEGGNSTIFSDPWPFRCGLGVNLNGMNSRFFYRGRWWPFRFPHPPSVTLEPGRKGD